MGLFASKKTVNMEDFCREFYDKFIFTPKIKGVDIRLSIAETDKKLITEADPSFKKVSIEKLNHELRLLQLETFALAWSHKFKEKHGIEQSIFTKKYLDERKQKKLWKDLKEYNKAIGESSHAGHTEETGPGRAYIGFQVNMRVSLFEKYHKQGLDPECVARALNREFTQDAWKTNYTQNYLAFAFCKRLGCEVNENAQLKIMTIIFGFYQGAKEAISEIKI